MRSVLVAAVASIAVCVCALTVNAIRPSVFAPHRMTLAECNAAYVHAPGEDWEWVGTVVETCVKLGHM
jgi:hypothetical protein